MARARDSFVRRSTSLTNGTATTGLRFAAGMAAEAALVALLMGTALVVAEVINWLVA